MTVELIEFWDHSMGADSELVPAKVIGFLMEEDDHKISVAFWDSPEEKEYVNIVKSTIVRRDTFELDFAAEDVTL